MALVFNCIALGDAMSSIQDTELMSSDEFLDIQQKFFYTANAWTGIRTGKLWNQVKGNDKLRKKSFNTLKSLVSNQVEGYENLAIDDLKVFNKWLAITGALGALASGIEAYRSWFKIDNLTGQEQIFERINFYSLLTLTGTSVVQVLGATGALTTTFTFGWPMMFVIAAATAIYLLNNYIRNKNKLDEYQKWLDNLPWGYSANRLRWSRSEVLLERNMHNSEVVQKALFDLHTIMEQPTIYQQPILRVAPNSQTQYPAVKQELSGIELHIQLPTSAARNGIKFRTNTAATEEELISGVWHAGVELETLTSSTNSSDSQSIYKLNLPIKGSTDYLALEIEYILDDESESSRKYWFQNSAKQRATYTAISDNTKQAAIISSLNSSVSELSLQE
jgi:hypothetical protein